MFFLRRTLGGTNLRRRSADGRRPDYPSGSLRITGVSPGLNNQFSMGMPTQQQQLFMAFPGIARTQGAMPPLNAIRTMGPVRATSTAGTEGRRMVRIEPPGATRPRKSKSVKQRPASPAVRGTSIRFVRDNTGVALEATYNIYVGAVKAGTSTKQRYRVRSANPEKRPGVRPREGKAKPA